jgi:hypothetical protein
MPNLPMPLIAGMNGRCRWPGAGAGGVEAIAHPVVGLVEAWEVVDASGRAPR